MTNEQYDELHGELAGIGYNIMQGLHEAFDGSKLVDMDDGVRYQRLYLTDEVAIDFQRWGRGRGWDLPFYLIPKYKRRLGQTGTRICQLDLSMVRAVEAKYQWYLKPSGKNIPIYEEFFGEFQDLPEDYREYILERKDILDAGNDSPAKGYMLADNDTWVDLINNLAELLVACYENAGESVESGRILEEEAMNDPEEFVRRYFRIRRNQGKFRQILRNAYDNMCAITGETPHQALEACHIQNHSEDGNNQRANGILLRADLHNLFDKRLIKINPKTYKVEVDPALKGTTYWAVNKKKIRKTIDGQYPSQEFLKIKYEE